MIFGWLLLPPTLWLAQSAHQGVGLGEEKQETLNKLNSMNILLHELTFQVFSPTLRLTPRWALPVKFCHSDGAEISSFINLNYEKKACFYGSIFFNTFTHSRSDNTFIFPFAQNTTTVVWIREADQGGSYQLQNSGNENFLRSAMVKIKTICVHFYL